METKKALLWAAIGAMALAALWSAFTFLFGHFTELETKLLLSTFTIGWYGLTASVSMTSNTAREHLVTLSDLAAARIFMGVGVLVSVVGVLISLNTIWTDWNVAFRDDWARGQWAATLATLSFTVMWLAILRVRDAANLVVALTGWGVAAAVVVLEVMLLVLVWEDGRRDLGEFFFRLMATLTVLSVAGTGILPLLRRAMRPGSERTV